MQNPQNPSSILDTIMDSQTQTSLNNFDPASLVVSVLSVLKDRDREIVVKRFGLDGQEVETLESIGQKYSLTRERVRQIEKDSLSTLKQKKLKELTEALELIFNTVIEHGNVMAEDYLLKTVLIGRAPEGKDAAAVRFLLNLSDQLQYVKETTAAKPCWSTAGFNTGRLSDVINGFMAILKETGQVISQDELFERFKRTPYYQEHALELSDKAVRSYLNVAKAIQVNPFGEIGLRDWSEVKPRDVGDKAYLVLKHHGKPEHYSEITRLINEHKFDDRTAFQETVHNELIKDGRFVLIGRGIYALSEWGYKKGVVADVIREVLKESGRPLTRDEIISEVMKRRLVKRNTILVGLSNRKNFQKVGKDKYTTAENSVSVS